MDKNMVPAYFHFKTRKQLTSRSSSFWDLCLIHMSRFYYSIIGRRSSSSIHIIIGRFIVFFFFLKISHCLYKVNVDLRR